jgi:hypothetical protein
MIGTVILIVSVAVVVLVIAAVNYCDRRSTPLYRAHSRHLRQRRIITESDCDPRIIGDGSWGARV